MLSFFKSVLRSSLNVLEIFKELQVFSGFKKLGPESFCFMFKNSHEIL